MEAERIDAINEMETKRLNLIKELESIEQIDLLTNALTYKIYELQHSNRKKLDALTKELNNLKVRDHEPQEDTTLQIEILEKKIKEITEAHEEVIRSLEIQKSVCYDRLYSSTRILSIG